VVVSLDGTRARAGDPDATGDTNRFPLRTGDSDFGTLELVGEEFDTQRVETAAALTAQAVVALENARLHRVVERQALVDGLTGLANRRSLDETLHAEVSRAVRFGEQICLVLCDLDNFKSVNDRFGHPCGDLVLRSFAQTLGETVRDIDTAGRWGGEEFAVVLPGTDLAGGTQLAERVRQAIEIRELAAEDGSPLPVTASFGVAVSRRRAAWRASSPRPTAPSTRRSAPARTASSRRPREFLPIPNPSSRLSPAFRAGGFPWQSTPPRSSRRSSRIISS
jgi:diguanylate cyclase (GGDEF)-like protein